MPSTLPSPEQMLAVATRWQRQSKDTKGQWDPFKPLIKQLHARQWKAAEITRRCLSEGWVNDAATQAFYRWVCRILANLKAGKSID